MLKKRIHISGSNVLILGLTFKENCPDIRNTRVTDIVDGLQSYGAHVAVYDPWADPSEVRNEYGIGLLEDICAPASGGYDAVILAVAHNEFKKLNVTELRNLCVENSVIYDIKSIFPRAMIDGRL
jgi:UDP-N-acetyl-D-galactosamine dehydrogenase